MSKRDEIAEHLEEAIVWDGFDEAIIGYTDEVAVYDKDKMADILIADGMTWEEAWDYLGFNVFCAYVGETTPIHITLLWG